MSLAPILLAGALLFVLAPACTMPGCGSFTGLVTMADEGCPDCAADHGCEDFMMVDDTPEGVASVSAPAIAVITLPETPAPVDAVASLPVEVESPQTPEYDPLGVRIRV